MKLKIIETAEYYLAVSDEEIKEESTGLFYDFNYNKITKKARNVSGDKYFSIRNIKKILAHQPKNNNAPELDLPLLPEMVVENEVEKLAEISSELQEGTYTPQHKATYKHGFIDGYNKCLKNLTR